jgi:hypothetical protein
LNCWKTKPSVSLRRSASSSRFISDSERWLISIWPEVGRSSAPIKFISDDFPEPEGPMMATNSPG